MPSSIYPRARSTLIPNQPTRVQKRIKKSNLANQARFRKMSNQNLGLKYEWISVFIVKELANFNGANIDNFESPNS